MLRCRALLVLLTAFVVGARATAAEPKWLELRAPGFDVVSQLNEQETRRWAIEFDQFMGALHSLYDVEEGALPPLTIVLFRQGKDFAPYRVVTASGQAQVAGFFARTDDWSMIGLSGGGRDAATRATIYHEAVHWFASASSAPAPLWFSEGIAEVLSSFRAIDGKGRWGEAIEDNVGYLQYTGLLPIEDLLRASQDEALHGRDRRYYPQAWAFVHYLMFGNRGAQASKLYEFVRAQRQTDLDTAFAAAFGKSYEEFTAELQRYVRSGRYSYAEVPLRDRGGEMTVSPASIVAVESALGRLALLGGNRDLALAHAGAVVALAPDSPVGYELRAFAAEDGEDSSASEDALDRAIALGSRDASVYRTKADRLVTANQSTSGFMDQLLRADVAREAADLYRRALGLRPRDAGALRGFSVALMNVTAPTDADRITVSAARVMSPTSGLALVSQAALEKGGTGVQAAADLLRRALEEPYTLPAGYRAHVSALRHRWLAEWVGAQLGSAIEAGRFHDARDLVTTHLDDATVTGALRTRLEKTQQELPYLERLHDAVEAGRAGRADEAIALLTALVEDPDTEERTRKTAERMLENRRTMAAAPQLPQ
jgi:tetratricopeptide (TPR) repeat protein